MTQPFRHYKTPMEKIPVSVPDEMVSIIGQRAERCGESRSAYIRRLIEADLRECGMLDGAA